MNDQREELLPGTYSRGAENGDKGPSNWLYWGIFGFVLLWTASFIGAETYLVASGETITHNTLLYIYLAGMGIPLAYLIVIYALPAVSELRFGDLTLKFREIEEKVDRQERKVEEQRKEVERQRRRIEEISNSQQNSLHSLSSLVIADPLHLKSYEEQAERRLKENKVILVGSQEYTESLLMCAIIVRLLEEERAHNPRAAFEHAHPRYDFGGANLNFIALSRGDIDIYPGYTWQGFEMLYGSALVASNGKLVEYGPEAAVEELNKSYLELSHPLRWFEPNAVENNFRIVTGKKKAADHKIKSISDLHGLDTNVVFGCDPDFFGRPNGYRLLRENDPLGYELSFKDTRFYDHEDLYATYERGDIDVFNAYSNDPELDLDRFKPLDDDKKLFGRFYSSWVVRERVVREVEGVEAALNRPDGKWEGDEITNAVERANRVGQGRDYLQAIEREARELVRELPPGEEWVRPSS